MVIVCHNTVIIPSSIIWYQVDSGKPLRLGSNSLTRRICLTRVAARRV